MAADTPCVISKRRRSVYRFKKQYLDMGYMPPIDRRRGEEYNLFMKENTGNAGKRRPNLSTYLFWDTDMRKLDYESRAPFIWNMYLQWVCRKTNGR